MTRRKVRGGIYNPSWRDQVAKGRARKRRERPKRPILAVRQALINLKLRYCHEVSFWNPLHKGKRGTWDGGLQWVDFIVKPKGKQAFVIILDDAHKRANEVDKRAHQVKQDGLIARKTPVLMLESGLPSMIYQIKITFFMRKLT